MLPDVQQSMWDVYQLTGDFEAAAEAIRVPSWTVRNWVREAGGLRPRRNGSAGPTTSRLSYAERMEIQVRWGLKESMRSIATALGRAPSTISREIKRHRGRRGGYSATAAQREAWQAAARPQPLKLGVEAAGSRLRKRVVAELVANRSPEQVSCRLRAEFGADPATHQGMAVATETIYRAIYLQARGGLKREVEAALAAQRAAGQTATAAGALRSGRVVRKPRTARRNGQGQIPDMISIRDRPPVTDDDGHWLPGHHEGDLILGTKCQSAIGTIVERASGYVWLLHLPEGHTAHHVHAAITEQLQGWPEVLKQSLTWDRGKEMSEHKQVTIDTAIKVYFADPHSPWQRPGNENINGLLRQYFPKGTDLSIHSRRELDRVAALLNDRPRARLNYAKPSELMTELMLR